MRAIFKVIGYFLYFILPIAFCVFGFFLGGVAGDAAFGRGYDKWETEQEMLHTHTVTIHWDENSTKITSLRVRDDLDWNISGYKSDYDYGLYYSQVSNDADIKYSGEAPKIIMPPHAKRDGYIFKGLYTSPLGGTQFINAVGYSVRNVTMDVDLYAVWQEIN